MLAKSVIAFLLVGVGFSCAIEQSMARPHFRQTEEIALPGGEKGKIRILRGEGIQSEDTIAIVADSQERAVARSHKASSLFIICDQTHWCRVFDFKNRLVSEPNPEKFRPGYILKEDATDWSSYLSGEDWGFSAREMTLSELVLGQFGFVRRNAVRLFVIFVCVAFGLLMLLALFRFARPWKRTFGVVWVIVSVVSLPVAVVILLLSLLLAYDIPSEQLVLLWIVAGAVALWLTPKSSSLKSRP